MLIFQSLFDRFVAKKFSAPAPFPPSILCRIYFSFYLEETQEQAPERISWEKDQVVAVSSYLHVS